jgi:hypothetical protein
MKFSNTILLSPKYHVDIDGCLFAFVIVTMVIQKVKALTQRLYKVGNIEVKMSYISKKVYIYIY